MCREFGDPRVERDEPAAVPAGERQQMCIGNLPVAGQLLERNLRRPYQVEVVRPEFVAGETRDGAQHRGCFTRGPSVAQYSPVRGDPDEPGLRDRGGRPCGRRVIGEPANGAMVMYVGGPRKGHQHVDIQQRRHESSLAARTISGVMGGLSRSTTKPGIERSAATERGRLPRRANSDSATPSETPRSCARARALARTSSSTFKVVRIASSLYHNILLPAGYAVRMVQDPERRATALERHLQRLDDGMLGSMSRRGECHDNAVIESWFSTVKFELGEHFETCGEAKRELFDYIEAFYNQRRRHSTLSQISPAEFERRRQAPAA